jgi:PAS domain S-box-containing protein
MSTATPPHGSEAPPTTLQDSEAQGSPARTPRLSRAIRLLVHPTALGPASRAPPSGRRPAGPRHGPSRAESTLVRALRRASRATAAMLIVGGGLVLLGWQLDLQALRAIGPANVVMNPLAALLFVLAGSVLLLGARPPAAGLARAWSAAIGVGIAACGLLVLLRSIAGWNAGIDQWLFREKVLSVRPPDWMAENTALSFLLLGAALVAQSRGGRTGRRLAHWLALPVVLISLLVVIGYLYGAAGFITFQLQLPMALNTALFFLAACFALLAAQPDEGVTALFVTDSAGGAITRRLLPALLLVPLVFGLLINLGMRSGSYGSTAGLALLTLATIVLSVLLTITTAGALHRSDLALRRSEEHFRALIEHASDFVTIVDRRGRIQYASPSVERVLGYPPEEVLGSGPERLMHPDDLAMARQTIDEVFDHPGEAFRAELRIRHRDGSWRIIENLARTLRDDSGEAGAVANARDVTDRKAAEVALQEAKDEADRANRAKSEFLSRMSHELRTPMNSILGFAQLLAFEELSASQKRAVERIRAAGDHLLRLINEVLDLARIEAGRQALSIEPVKVAGLMRETLDLARPIASQYERELSEEIPPEADRYVLADRQRLTQVLLNLVTNAIKYNRAGGGVRFLCRVDEGTPRGVRVVIGVWDNGPGIATERLGELFTPFARLGAEGSGIEGTGLGLSLSKRLVEAMGGEIRVDTVPDVGSTFWVELPLASSPMESLPDGAPSSGALAKEFAIRRPARILYIEDNLANLDLIESIFASFPGVRLVPALQGRLGLELAREHRPDLILLDLHLPDLSGEVVLRSLRDEPQTSSIPVVVISADATPGQIPRLRAAGVQEYLTKPIDVQRFLETVQNLLSDPAGGLPSRRGMETEPESAAR